MDWTSGYVAEIDYTHGYYRELAPGLIDYALILGGYEPPDRTSMRYLELGYGQGLSVNIHAAACPGEFWGTDFNPATRPTPRAWRRFPTRARGSSTTLSLTWWRARTCRSSPISACMGCGAGSLTRTAKRSWRSSAAS